MGAGFSAIPLSLFSGPAEHRPLENVNGARQSTGKPGRNSTCLINLQSGQMFSGPFCFCGVLHKVHDSGV
jgi:hypothetical protein